MGHHARGAHVLQNQKITNWSMKAVFNKSAVLEQETQDPDQFHKRTHFTKCTVLQSITVCVHRPTLEHRTHWR